MMSWKRLFGSAALIAISIMSLMACNSIDLSKEKIHDIQFKASQDVLEHGVVPGQSYSLQIHVVIEREDGKFETIEDFDYSQLKITETNLNYDGYNLSVPKSNLAAWKAGYAVQIEVINNTFPAKTLSLQTNWGAFDHLFYYGAKGSNGSAGSNNAYLRTPGGYGMDGAQGPALTVRSARVSANGANWRLFRIGHGAAETPDFVLVPEANSFELKSIGGDGGNGGDGANGIYQNGSSQICLNVDSSTASIRASGTHGGNGGNGGDGGTIRYAYYSADAQFGMTLQSVGGDRGFGGRGGTYSSYCDIFGKNGESGLSGMNGASGPVVIEHTDRATTELQFQGLDLNGLSFID